MPLFSPSLPQRDDADELRGYPEDKTNGPPLWESSAFDYLKTATNADDRSKTRHLAFGGTFTAHTEDSGRIIIRRKPLRGWR